MYYGLGLLWLGKNVQDGLPKSPDVKLDDMDAGKRSERMSAVFQLVKILVGLEKKRPVALYDNMIRKSSRHVWEQT